MRFIFHWNEYFKKIGLNEINIFPNQFYLDNLRDLSYNEQMQSELKNIDKNVKLIDFKGKNKFFNELNSIKQLLTLNQNRHHRYYNVTNVLLNAEFNFNEIILNDKCKC